jgi:hypothetical protein
MASITRERNGRRTIQFVAADGRRRSIRLDKVSQRTAEAVKTRVQILNAAEIAGHAVDGDTAGWVANLDTPLADKLAAVGLVPSRERATLAAFLDSYIDGRCDVKPRTRLWYRQTRENLVAFFGAAKPLHEITERDAEDWRLFLIGKVTPRPPWAGVVSKYARQFFSAAAKHYLQVTDEHYTCASEAVQNPVQSAYATARKASQAGSANPVFAGKCEALQYCANVQVRLAGIEPATYGLGNRCSIP